MANSNSNLKLEEKSLIETLAENFSDFSVNDIPKILPQIMAQVDTYKNLNYDQKKNMIVKMLKHLVDVTDGPGDDDVWDPIIKGMIPGLIDLLVANNKGKLVLKNRKRWLRFIPCL